MQTNRRSDKLSENDVEPSSTDEKLRNARPGLRWKLIVIVLLVVGIAGFGVFKFVQSKNSTPAVTHVGPRPVLTVATEPARVATVHQEIKVTGSIWARDPLSIAAEANGLRIDSVLVDEGYQVKKGQVLAVLNSSVLVAELARERAQLASAEASYRKSLQPNRREDINALRAVVAQAIATMAQQRAVKVQAEANLQNARSNSRRYNDLLTQGAVSAQEAESKDTTSRVAEAELHNAEEKIRAADFVHKQAQERLSMAESGGRTEDIQIARAEVERCKANVFRLEALIEQTRLKAPSDGLITRRDAHIGDTSTAGKSLFQMIRDNQIELRAQVPEKDLTLLAPNLPVTIASAALAQKKIEGKIREIGSQVDPDTRLCTVKIDVASASGLKPGMFAEGHVRREDFRALTVPSKAMISKDNRYLVFVFEQNRSAGADNLAGGLARVHVIQPGARSGDSIEVISGIHEGDLIITNGAGFLKDGDTVEAGR